MWWVKCIGSCLILGGCGYLGWQQGAKLRRRIGLLREMIQGFIIFKKSDGDVPISFEYCIFQNQ